MHPGNTPVVPTWCTERLSVAIGTGKRLAAMFPIQTRVELSKSPSVLIPSAARVRRTTRATLD